MRKINRLSTPKIKALMKAGTPGRFGDGNGLWFQVSKWGTGAWILRYEADGRARHMGLGSINDVDLATARKRAQNARLMLKGGDDPTKRLDPIEAKRAERDRARADARDRLTFKEAAEQFLAVHESQWRNDKHKQQWRNTLRDYVFRSLGNRPISAIDAAIINETVAPIWADKAETARRVKQRVERVVEWVKTGMPLPTSGAARGVKHHAAMPYLKLPAFVAELRRRKSVSAKALEFLILTAARTGELIGAQWSEIDGDTWTIPASRMKARVEHRVPLCDRALAILQELPREAGNDHIFVGLKGAGLSNMAMLKLLKEIDGNGFTPHGMRSAFCDWRAEETSFPQDIAEAALAHTIKNKVQAAYERGDKLKKRRVMMNAWATYLDRPVVESGNVVTMKRA